MLIKKNVGFIGGGRMGGSLIKGILSNNFDRSRIFVSDPSKGEQLEKEFHINNIKNNSILVENADVVIIAVKPANVFDVIDEISDAVDDTKLIISIAAGVNLDDIKEHIKGKGRLIRVMPNICALVRESASCIFCGPKTTLDDQEAAIALLSLVGKTVVIKDESLMNAVTGLSGSGPAYAFIAIEALSDGAVKMGLDRASAKLLAAQSLLGAAKMVLETKIHPEELKDMVTSPGGTTAFGLSVLENRGFRSALIDAVNAAAMRSIELSGGKDNK